MHKTELQELIRNGENSGVEFKRDDIHVSKLAKEITALLNLKGGYILLGVEKSGEVTGLTRPPEKAEEWVMEAARTHVQPAAIPFWEVLVWDEGKIVGVVSLPPDAPDKPYKVKRSSAWVTQVRVGTTSRDATREEEERLYQQSGRLQYGMKPVLGATLDAIDRRRLRDYFIRILRGKSLDDDGDNGWQTLLTNLDLAVSYEGRTVVTVDGMILFGKNPKRYLPQTGIRAISYLGEVPDYATRADENLTGALVPLGSKDGTVVEAGLVDSAWDFIRRNTTSSSYLEGARRIDRWDYPEQVVREAIVNAVVHRDYSIAGTDIMLMVFSNRLEIQSPGKLPNTVTPEGIRSGLRYARNQTLVNVMRDYGYVDARGMGIRNKVIPGMREHNGTEPDLIEEEHRFTIRLWKESS